MNREGQDVMATRRDELGEETHVHTLLIVDDEESFRFALASQLHRLRKEFRLRILEA